jgi:hypothetical protein
VLSESLNTETEKLVGCVFDVIEPSVRRQDEGFYGFIVTNADEKLYFHCRDLRCGRPRAARQFKNKIVIFDAVQQSAHAMRKAINIDLLLSGETRR